MQTVVSNAFWTLQENDDGTFTLLSADGSISVTMSKDQVLALSAIVEAAKDA